jgi:bifunctional UDP-N-acetylglucosamine pyrophosphorylase / glucosamine-1-phosphate N-acetyltransferase
MSTAAVVLAAGQGTRFRSGMAKVLHRACGQTMLRWVLDAVRPLGLDRTVIVVGRQADDVRAEAAAADLPGLMFVEQHEQNGTGHAVRTAVEAGALDGIDSVLVLPGDVPLLLPAPLQELLARHDKEAVTLLTAVLDDPTGYGRVVRGPEGEVQRVVEHGDASELERAIREVATSVYVFDRDALADAVSRIGGDNVQGEEYLTDAVGLLAGTAGVAAVEAPAQLVAGVNDRAQLAAAAGVLRRRILDRLMVDGVTVVDPETTYVHAGVAVGVDAVLLPGSHLEGATTVGERATVGPNTRLVDATVEDDATVTYSVLLGASVGPGATVGPFSYLRPGTRLERGAKAGAFVEMKKAVVGAGSKVPHLSYLGDATVGQDVNVGAGTITCNYDGREKHLTVIEDGAFIGSDTMLVAPVKIGRDAYTGAGSAITRDVPPGALAVERSEQRTIPGYAGQKAGQDEDSEDSEDSDNSG